MTATDFGRTGPYPADQRRFDPLKFDAPGEWSQERHPVGGNVVLGFSYERVGGGCASARPSSSPPTCGSATSQPTSRL